MTAESRKKLWRIVLAVSLVLFVAAVLLLLWWLLPRGGDVDPVSPTGASAIARSEKTGNGSGETSSLSEESLAAIAAAAPMKEKFDAVAAQNSDLCAWITIPGTKVDDVIARSGDDTEENFYLNHNKKKKSSAGGTLYMQRVNLADFSDACTVIYGHNMANNTMFGTLGRYRKENFFKSNNVIYVYKPGHILTYRIYSAFQYDDRNIMNAFDFRQAEEYEKFLAVTRRPKSTVRHVDESVSVTTENRILVLSTCVYNQDTQRYLVVGVLTDDQPIQ